MPVLLIILIIILLCYVVSQSLNQSSSQLSSIHPSQLHNISPNLSSNIPSGQPLEGEIYADDFLTIKLNDEIVYTSSGSNDVSRNVSIPLVKSGDKLELSIHNQSGDGSISGTWFYNNESYPFDSRISDGTIPINTTHCPSRTGYIWNNLRNSTDSTKPFIWIVP